MPKIYLIEAIGLIGKTMPFIWLRLGSYLLLGLVLGVYFAIIGGIAWMLGSLWGPLGIIVFVAGIGGASVLLRWATRYYFYLLKAAHTAVMTEFIVRDRAPEGSQIDFGRNRVTERFRDTSVMFAVDVLVDGAVKAVVRTFTRIASILPVPGMRGLGRLLERVAVASTTFVDESILSRAYARREQNVWKVAHDGVVLYAQAWKPILANAVVLALLGYLEFFLLLALFGMPALAIAAVLPGLRIALAIGVILVAWMVKLAVADALALAATLLAYHHTTAAMEPNPEWVAKIEGVSDKFRELGNKAVESVRRDGADVVEHGSLRPPEGTTVPVGEAQIGTMTPAAAAATTATSAVSAAPLATYNESADAQSEDSKSEPATDRLDDEKH